MQNKWCHSYMTLKCYEIDFHFLVVLLVFFVGVLCVVLSGGGDGCNKLFWYIDIITSKLTNLTVQKDVGMNIQVQTEDSCGTNP